MKIKVKYHSDFAKPLTQAHEGEWIDLRCAETIYIPEGQSARINLGISVKAPDGYECIMAPRSSTFKNYGLLQTNSIGVIDQAYSGNGDVWQLSVFATRDTTINAGDRVAQFRLVKQQGIIEIEETDDLGDNNRGGHGSTGVQ